MPLFLHVRFLDVLDILLVAILLYQLYMLVRGTVALNIIIAIIIIYFFWGLVKMLRMELLSSIIGQVISVGVIALIIVFQQEIRRFLIVIGTRYINKNKLRLEGMFKMDIDAMPKLRIKSIVKAVINLSNSKTGALIVIKRKSNLEMYAQAGDVLDANTSSRLIISIFNKNSPLHDGAIIIDAEKIFAARVVLPVTDNPDLPPDYGLRHRAALGTTEVTDALVIAVSEETGKISIAENNEIDRGISAKDLMARLESEFQNV
ncbi:MAG: TIGR00159 family protein [Bacteroidales bacterium]|nr:TIGR00159 family protein [Bacteroidales bacterium]MCB9000018.1 TIGR00159 family protein [Bacteroidales bacterium]MCB9013252.1 TIGR00159 family protein [Bacteroidales bacterium]